MTAISPMMTVDRYSVPRKGHSQRAMTECPRCLKLYCRVLTLGRRVKTIGQTDHLVATRMIFCDHCPRIVMADFPVNPDTGRLEDRPVHGTVVSIVDRASIDQLLRLHPDLAGVTDA